MAFKDIIKATVRNLQTLLKNKSKLLAVFPHPDDESFTSAGLFQMAQEFGVNTSLITLTKGENGENSDTLGNLKKIREKELSAAAKILGIDNVDLWNFPDTGLRETKKSWVTKLKNEISSKKPDIILTFDHSGITGHPDHIVVSVEVLAIIKSMKKKPLLLWRVPDNEEKIYFKDNHALAFASKPNYFLDLNFFQSLKKILAVFTHKSQMKNFAFKLHILEWFLFDHKELYINVDLKKPFTHRFVFAGTVKKTYKYK